MSNIPILPEPDSTSVKREETLSDEMLDSAMYSGEESDEEFNKSADEADMKSFEESYAATSSSSFSSEKAKTEPPSYTYKDVKSLPPPPKGIPSNAKPYYYALEKVKVKRDEAQAKLDQLRQKTEEVKKQYEALCEQLVKKESEVAALESDVSARSDAFFEARLEENDDWNIMYKQLRAYRDEHGDLHLEKDDNPDLEKLKRWAKKQRETRKRGSIKPFREAALDRLNFPWKPKDDLWNEKYNELVSYKETHGHLLVDKDENPDLAYWVKLQQYKLINRDKQHHISEISCERDRLLLDIGLKGHTVEMKWDLNYDMALRYKVTHGKLPPSRDPLGAWLVRQKTEYRSQKKGENCRLSPEQVSKLDRLGFADDLLMKDAWTIRFDELVEYKKEHGCFPPIQVDRVKTKLGAWISCQRSNFKNLREGKPHMLTAERIKKLDDIGFPWSVGHTFVNPPRTWQQRYEELVAYHIQHGHCRVSIGDKENYSLAKWVKRQRENYWAMKEGRPKSGPMTPERMRLLEALGFSWQVRSRRSGPEKKQKNPG